jgi:hypothetical protein
MWYLTGFEEPGSAVVIGRSGPAAVVSKDSGLLRLTPFIPDRREEQLFPRLQNDSIL